MASIGMLKKDEATNGKKAKGSNAIFRRAKDASLIKLDSKGKEVSQLM